MFLSIVTVTFNDFEALQHTYKSILSQNSHLCEWIVIDGCSTDKTTTFLQSLPITNYKYISEPDSGIYDAMNKGTKLATGQFILFLNAGDTFSSSTSVSDIYRELSSLSRPPSVAYFASQYRFPSGVTYVRPSYSPSKIIWYGLPANHQSTIYSSS